MDGLPCFHILQTPGQGLALHHHALSAAVGIVIRTAALVGGIVPDVVAADVQQSGITAAADDAFPQGAVHHLGEQGEDVNSHGAASLLWCGW